MSGQSKKTQSISIRLPNKEIVLVDAYADENELNRSQAILSLIRKGLEKTGSEPVTKSDLIALAATIEKAIANQPIAIQETPHGLALPSPDDVEEIKNMSWWQFRKWKRGNNG